MTTTRALRDEIKTVLDYLSDAELALYTNDISMQATRVTWHAHKPAAQFMATREHATVEQYLHWVATGSYSALLRDGSLLQITYDVAAGKVVGHRLAYVPCPVILEQSLVDEGHPIVDIVGLYQHANDVALRSPLRLDYDAAEARPGHPAAHLTINGPDCRIACVAPMHVLRFVDFVYRHFYPQLWSAHSPFFSEAAWRHAGDSAFLDDRTTPHLMWDVHATAATNPTTA